MALRQRPVRSAAAVTILSLTLAGCAARPEDASRPSGSVPSTQGTPADASLTPVRIGYISQEKELLSIVEARQAAQAGIAYVNAERGGIDGHPVELDVCEAGDSPESAVSCAQRFVNDDSVVLVITSTYSDPTVVGITSAAGLATITTNTTPADWQVSGAWAFDAGVASLVQGATTFLSSSVGASSTVFLCADDPGILELCDAGAELFRAGGIEVTRVVPVSLDQADYTGTIAAAGIDDVDAVTVVLDRSQCLAVAEALSLAADDKPTLSFDACLRPEVLASGQLDGWFEMVASALPVDSDDPAVQEGRRILESYSEEPYASGFAAYGLAATVAGTAALSTVPNADLTRESAGEALADFSVDLGWYPPIHCPGPGVFPGACVRQVAVIEAKGEGLVLADQIDIDVTSFEELL